MRSILLQGTLVLVTLIGVAEVAQSHPTPTMTYHPTHSLQYSLHFQADE